MYGNGMVFDMLWYNIGPFGYLCQFCLLQDINLNWKRLDKIYVSFFFILIIINIEFGGNFTYIIYFPIKCLWRVNLLLCDCKLIICWRYTILGINFLEAGMGELVSVTPVCT